MRFTKAQRINAAQRLVAYARKVSVNPVDRRAAAKAAYRALSLALKLLNAEETPGDLIEAMRDVVDRIARLDRGYGKLAREKLLHWRIFQRYWPSEKEIKAYVKSVVNALLWRAVRVKTEFLNDVKIVLRLVRNAGLASHLVDSRIMAKIAGAIEEIALSTDDDVTLGRLYRLWYELRQYSTALGVDLRISGEAFARMKSAYNAYMREYMREWRRSHRNNYKGKLLRK